MAASRSLAPAARPCASCPYRRDVPAGVWDEEEYAKLPVYDLPIYEQALRGALGAFHCHQLDGRLCAGWVAVHGDETLSLRMIVGMMDEAEADKTLDYETDVPLFSSGTEAAAHGMSGVENPGPDAVAMIERVGRKIDKRRAT